MSSIVQPYDTMVRIAHITGVSKRSRGSAAMTELENYIHKLQKLYVIVSNGDDLDSTLARLAAPTVLTAQIATSAPIASTTLTTTTVTNLAVAPASVVPVAPVAPASAVPVAPASAVPVAPGAVVPVAPASVAPVVPVAPASVVPVAPVAPLIAPDDPQSLVWNKAAIQMRNEALAQSLFPPYSTLALGMVFKMLGIDYIVIGWKNSSPMYPVLTCPLSDLKLHQTRIKKKVGVMLVLESLGKSTQTYRDYTILKYAKRHGVHHRYLNCDLLFKRHKICPPAGSVTNGAMIAPLTTRLYCIMPCQTNPIMLQDVNDKRIFRVNASSFQDQVEMVS